MPEPSEWTKRLWEKLQDVIRNEEAWEIIEDEASELLKSFVHEVKEGPENERS
jgi:hypothetical protein